MSPLAIRPGERRDAWAAFFTLFGLIGSHAVLETARDALFLAKISANRLPWVFLATAALSLLVVRVQSFTDKRLTGRPALAAWTLAASTVTLTFFLTLGSLGRFGLYALYVWSGVLTTLVLVHFWTLIAGVFSVTQAKRLFGFIGAGSALGASAGSALSGALSRMMAPQSLLLISAIGFALTAGITSLFRTAGEVQPDADPSARLVDRLRFVTQRPYARRVVFYLFVSTACLTVSDFVFKSAVARAVPAAELATFFGTVYFVLNLASLVCQLAIVSRVLRRLSVGASLAILPVLLVTTGLGVLIAGGLVAVMAVKTVDGALRYSLHRTASELLFLPFSDRVRRRFKALSDIVGQRGGQVVASVAVLGLGSLHAHFRVAAGLLVVLAAGWVAAAIGLRDPYLELFRARLKTGRLSRLEEFPELDMASLETLIAALDSHRDAEVIAALDVLEREHKTHVIPGLILYHPSDAVVERALAVFTSAARSDVVQVIHRVLDHPSPRVRAAFIAARSVLSPEAEPLWQRLEVDPSEEVRATIVANLVISGAIPEAERAERIEALLRSGEPAAKVALAEAISRREATGFHDVLVALSSAKETEVRLAVIEAIGRTMDPELIPVLVELLAEEATRDHAERVLVKYGEDGLRSLRHVLETGSHTALRWRVPRAMSRFEAEPAASALLAWLPSEGDGGVRHQIIGALELLVRRNPALSLDREVLFSIIDQTAERAFRYLDCRMGLAAGAVSDASLRTQGHELLLGLLQDKHENAIERLFRLLGLAHPEEDFAQIHRGLRGGKDARATSMELIENVLSDPLRAATLGLVDDLPDEERLGRSGKYHRALGLGYNELLAYLLETDRETVQDVVVFHLGELGLSSFRDQIERLPNPDGARSDVTRTLSLFAAHSEETTPQ